MNTLSTAEKNKIIPFYVKHFKIFVVLLFLILLLPGYFLLINPENTKYKQNKSSALLQEQTLNQKMLQLQKYKKIIINYEALDPQDKQKIGEIIPIGPDEANLYINLESLAEQVRAEVSSINIQLNEEKNPTSQKVPAKTPAEPVQKNITGQLKSLTVNLSLTSISYNKIKQLFALIETNVRLMDIKSFVFSPSDGSLSLVLTAYYLR